MTTATNSGQSRSISPMMVGGMLRAIMQPITACAISTSCCGTRTPPPATASRMAAIIGPSRSAAGSRMASRPRANSPERMTRIAHCWLVARLANDLWNCRLPPVRRAAGGRDSIRPTVPDQMQPNDHWHSQTESATRARRGAGFPGAKEVGEPQQSPSKITQEGSQMKFRPLHDRVVVRRLEAEEKTAGGIIIPDTAKEKPMEGEVIAVGPGARDEAGKLVPLDVKANDRILFGKWSGTEVKLDGEELLIMKESDIMGIIEGQPAAKRKAA